jgi:cytochrome bd-type quinol oxidase subunit 2
MILTNKAFLAVGIPAIIVVIELWLKFAARRLPQGKRHPFVREDFLWGFTWVVSASVAFVAFLVTQAIDLRDKGQKVTVEELDKFFSLVANGTLVLFAILLVGLSMMPTFVNRYGYRQGAPIPRRP